MNNQFMSLAAGPISFAAIALLFGAAINESLASEGADAMVGPSLEASSLPCPYSEPIGLLGDAQSVGNRAVGIDVQGDYAYVGDWHQGSYHRYAGVFQVFDVSNPCYPTRLPNWVETTFPNFNEIGDVTVHGARAYLANDANGFAVYDISDPNNPQLMDQRNDSTYAHSVFYEGGDYAYVGYGSRFAKPKELAIYDVSALPLAPPVFHAAGGGGLHDVYVAGERAYVFSSSEALAPTPAQQLDIVDLSDHFNPTTVSTLVLREDAYGGGGEIRVQGDYAYLAMADAASHPGGLRVVDISDEYSPTLVAASDVTGGAGGVPWKGIGLAIASDRAYIAALGGLWVFDVSEPADPLLLDNFSLPAEFVNSMGAHVEVRANLAYVTAYGSVGGLAIYKVHELPYPVAIDIKPGSDRNSINLCSRGAVEVAIFGSDAFNVDWVNIDTLRLAGAPVRIVGKRYPHALCGKDFINDDPEYDLVCHFVTSEMTGIAGEPPAAKLNGILFDGAQIEGADTVNVVQEDCGGSEAS